MMGTQVTRKRGRTPSIHRGARERSRTALCAALLALVAGAATAQQRAAVPVSVVTVSAGQLHNEIPLSGSVVARRVSLLSSKVDGSVAEMLIEAGDEVRAGAPLVRLDKVMAQIELSSAQSRLDEAQARLKEARRQRDEARRLVNSKHIAKTAFEEARAAVEINSAAVQRLRAEVTAFQETLARHDVTAPFDGVVSRKLVEVGQWVETSTALLELVEIRRLRVDVQVPQHYFAQIEPGTPVTMRLDSLPERVFSAEVTRKIPVGHASARTFPVRIELANDEGLIAPGMSARVRLRLSKSAESLLLPRDAVVKAPDGSESVWVLVEQDGVETANRVIVETGLAARDLVEITADALKVGDRVVVRGNEILRPGQPVRVTETLRAAF